uniref:(California timema) hypothetical protein n=1 Tax=Timema californicum TaxID=61474 RepID=A0A7R9P4W6_TIMCA|nr:unnamed protein product [Timema californicum]
MKINADVEERISSVQHAIRFVRNSLQEMEMQIQDTDDDTTALTRIKIVQHSTLSKLFMEAIQEYNSTLVRHRERCANLLKQQILITDKTVNYEELQELLDREESAIFVDNPNIERGTSLLKDSEVHVVYNNVSRTSQREMCHSEMVWVFAHPGVCPAEIDRIPRLQTSDSRTSVFPD